MCVKKSKRGFAMGIVEKSFNNGEVIVKEGENGTSFFRLIEGSANVFADYGKKDQFRLAVLNAGEFFGEMAIIEEYPRSATIVANSRVTVMEIPGDELTSFFTENPDMLIDLIKHLGARVQSMSNDYEDAKNLLDNLRESDAGKKKSLFSKIKKHMNIYQSNKDSANLEPGTAELIDAFEKITDEASGNIWPYENGSVIYSEGEYGEGLYILRNGKVGIYKDYGTADQVKLEDLSAISVFGEMGIVSEETRTATAVAEDNETYIEIIYQKDLEAIINLCPVKVEAILRHLSYRLRKINIDFIRTCKEITETYEQK